MSLGPWSLLVGILVGLFVGILAWVWVGIVNGIFVGAFVGLLAGVFTHAFRRGLLSYVVELFALSIWIGGLIIIISSVIPAVFNSLSMESGGRLLTQVFSRYDQIVFGAIFVMLCAWAIRHWHQKRFSHATISRSELVLQISMLMIAVGIFLLGKQSVTLQEIAFAAQGETEKKLAFESFFKIHNIIRGLYLLNLGLGIALLLVKLKAWLPIAEVPS
jgi:uncharacterized membrane protein